MVVPSKEELEQAIGSFVSKNKTVDFTKVKQYLKKDNPSWQIPDRRLRKFLKTQTVESESARIDDAMAKKSRFGLKMFGAKSKTEESSAAPTTQATTSAPEGAPVLQQEAPPEEEDSAPSPIKEEKSKVTVPKVTAGADPISISEITAQAKEVKVTYLDDNEGEQEKPCFACASCIVM